MKDKVAVYYFIASTLAIAFLMFLLNRQKKSLAKLVYDVQREKLSDMIKDTDEAAATAGASADEKKESYEKLKKRYKSTLTKLNLKL